MISIEHAKIEGLTDDDLQRTFALLIYAYAETEKEIWGEGYSRLDLDEFIDLIKKGQIYIARYDEEIVGSIQVYRTQQSAFAFSLLNADFSRKGLGIGKKLIQAAEKHAVEHGAKSMNIEILRPNNAELPSKTMLHKWYENLGYSYVKSMEFLEMKPDKVEKAKEFITPSRFDCYSKPLPYTK